MATVDDDVDARAFMRAVLEAHGFRVEEHGSGTSILGRETGEVSIVCLDLGLGDMEGLEVLARLQAKDAELPVIVVTAARVVETAVQAMREGACDYVTKPLEPERLISAVERAIARRLQPLRAAGKGESSTAQVLLIGESERMSEVRRQIDQVAASHVPVCVLGESGTGKELVARALHSPRTQRGPFIAVNCPAIPESLQESELFGHERGAFTGAHETYRGSFEQASHGTIFLDELGELPLSSQAKLLRVLQERSFRRIGGTRDIAMTARVVCATNRELSLEVQAGRFRSDLFYRLVVYPIRLPPLRERREDIPELVDHILKRQSGGGRDPCVGVTAEGMAALAAYDWPGNVRELENVLQRATLARRSETISASDLTFGLFEPPARSGATPSLPPVAARSAPVLPLAELERTAIAKAMDQAGGDVGRAAALLGTSRATVYRRLSKLGSIPPPPASKPRA